MPEIPNLVVAPLALQTVEVFNPAILNLALALNASDAFPRSQATAPVSPVDPVTDDVLFEDAADPGKHLYLPRYELIERSSDEYAVAIEGRGTEGWALTVALKPVPAPGLDIGGAGELPHAPSVTLAYQQPGGGQRALAFDPPQRDGGELRAELPLPDMALRDSVVRGLSDPDAQARLVVRRAFDVCVPVPGPVVPEPGQTPPILIDRDLFADRLRSAPHLGDRLSAMPAMRTPGLRPVDPGGGDDGPEIDPLPHPRPAPDPEPPLPEPPQPAPPAEPRFRRSTGVLDAQVGDSFTFDRGVHAYVYREVVDAAPGSGRLRQHRVRFGDRMHRYLQDPDQRNLFYCLPDEFRIPRTDRGAHAPLLSVTIDGGDDPQDVKVVTDYGAVAVVDPERLKDATVRLAGKVPAGLGAPEFERFDARSDHLRYRVRLPQDGGGIAAIDVTDAASVDLGSIKHAFALDPDLFQTVFEALRGAVSTAFEGTIELTLDGDQQPDYIPVLTRAEDFAGDVLEVAGPQTIKAPEGADVTLRNLIESPIRLTDVRASIVVDGVENSAAVTGPDLSVPLELKSGQSATLHVAFADPAPDGSQGQLSVRAKAEVVPDREALWNAIFDPTSPVGWRRALTVDGELLFAPIDGEAPLTAVVVEFDTGDEPVKLTPEAPSVDTRLAMPIGDFVLGKANGADKAPFSYRCRVPGQPTGAEEPKWQPGSFPSIQTSLA